MSISNILVNNSLSLKCGAMDCVDGFNMGKNVPAFITVTASDLSVTAEQIKNGVIVLEGTPPGGSHFNINLPTPNQLLAVFNPLPSVGKYIEIMICNNTSKPAVINSNTGWTNLILTTVIQDANFSRWYRIVVKNNMPGSAEFYIIS